MKTQWNDYRSQKWDDNDEDGKDCSSIELVNNNNNYNEEVDRIIATAATSRPFLYLTLNIILTLIHSILDNIYVIHSIYS